MINKDFLSLTLKSENTLNVLATNVIISSDTKVNPKSEKKNYIAIWDTGASNTVISDRVVKKMNLMPVGKATSSTANGIRECFRYLINIVLPNSVQINQVLVTEALLSEDVDVLIGMDIITTGDFAITNVDKRTTFTFRIPSCEEIDYCEDAQKIKNKRYEQQLRKLERQIAQYGNSKCSCGSGKKYRYCHGKEEMQKLKEQVSIK